MGIKMNSTTAYHPQANGLVERLHRQLKASIMARSTARDWMDQLPMVMLGIRTAWRTELECSPAELVYGTALRVPGLQITEVVDKDQVLPSTEFVQDLFKHMRALAPTEMAHHATAKIHVPSALEGAESVYIRTDAVRAPLVRPYTGPFQVLQRSAKYFTLSKNGKTDTVSVDRLKPAYVFDNNKEEFESARKNTKRYPTQPLGSERTKSDITVTQPREPETSTGPGTSGEVTCRDYRAALLRDPPDVSKEVGRQREKRTYVKRKSEIRSDTVTTRSGRISRPRF